MGFLFKFSFSRSNWWHLSQCGLSKTEALGGSGQPGRFWRRIEYIIIIEQKIVIILKLYRSKIIIIIDTICNYRLNLLNFVIFKLKLPYILLSWHNTYYFDIIELCC